MIANLSHSRPKIIGLTGGIASGKSTVADLLIKKGYFLLCADQLAHKVLAKTEVIEQIKSVFGTHVIENNQIHRPKLAELVFNDSQQLKKLNQIIHPKVLEELLNQTKAQKLPLVFWDVALLFETGIDNYCDLTILVDVPLKTQKQRLKTRDGLDNQQIDQRIAAQMPLAEKRKKADFMIDNSGNLEQTKRNLHFVLNQIETKLS